MFWIFIFTSVFVLLFVLGLTAYSCFVESSLYRDGLRLKEMGQKLAARGRFQELLKRNENHPGARWQLGLLYEEEFERTQAIEQFEYLLRRNLFDSQVTEKQLRMHLADAYRKEGLNDRAIEEYKTLLSRFPQDLEGLQKQGELLFENDDIESALGVYQKITEIDTEQTNAYFMCGKILSFLKRNEEAVGFLKHAVDLDPGNIEVRTLLGNIYEQEEEFERAFTQYQKIIELEKPPKPGIIIRLATCEFYMAHYHESITSLQSVISIENLSDSLKKEAIYTLLLNYLAKNNTRDASDALEELYEMDHHYRDVPELMKKVSGMLSDEEIVEKIDHLHIYDFQEKIKEIVQKMDYEIHHAELVDDTSVNLVVVRPDNPGKKTLIYARKWTGQIGQFPLNELNLALVREKVLKGIFMAPGEFKTDAIQFKELNRNIELVGRRAFCALYRKTLCL